jgi:hypothetical protein
VIIYNLDLKCVARPPDEADSILIVHTNTVLVFAIAFERFKAIARGHSQILQSYRSMQHPELSESNVMNALRKTLRPLTMK